MRCGNWCGSWNRLNLPNTFPRPSDNTAFDDRANGERVRESGVKLPCLPAKVLYLFLRKIQIPITKLQTISKFEIRNCHQAISIEQSVSGFNVVIYQYFDIRYWISPPVIHLFSGRFSVCESCRRPLSPCAIASWILTINSFVNALSAMGLSLTKR